MSEQNSADEANGDQGSSAPGPTPGNKVSIEVWIGDKSKPGFEQAAFEARSIKTARRLAESIHNKNKKKYIFPEFLIRDESGVPIRSTIHAKFSHVQFHDVDQYLRKAGPQYPLFFREGMPGYGVPLAGRRDPGIAYIVGYEGPYLTEAVILLENGEIVRRNSFDSIKNDFLILPTHSIDKSVLAQILGYRFTTDEALKADHFDGFFRQAFDAAFDIYASSVRTDPDQRYAALRRAQRAMQSSPPGIFRAKPRNAKKAPAT